MPQKLQGWKENDGMKYKGEVRRWLILKGIRLGAKVTEFQVEQTVGERKTSEKGFKT